MYYYEIWNGESLKDYIEHTGKGRTKRVVINRARKYLLKNKKPNDNMYGVICTEKDIIDEVHIEMSNSIRN